MFCSELLPLASEKSSSHAHKTGFWYVLGLLRKIFNEHPFLCVWESSQDQTHTGNESFSHMN